MTPRPGARSASHTALRAARRSSTCSSALTARGWSSSVPAPAASPRSCLTRARAARLATLDVPANGAPGPLAFSPDGRTIAVGYTVGAPPEPGPSYVARFDARSGRRLAAPRAVNRGGEGALAYTADGSGLITSDPRSAILRDAHTLRRLRRVARVGSPLTSTSPDGRTLLVGGADGSVHFVDLRSGRERIASGRHNGAALRADFAPDGRHAITAGADGTLIVWDVATAAPEETFKGHAGRVHGIAVSPDGRTAYSAGLDGRIFIWDLAGDRRLGRPFCGRRRGHATAPVRTQPRRPADGDGPGQRRRKPRQHAHSHAEQDNPRGSPRPGARDRLRAPQPPPRRGRAEQASWRWSTSSAARSRRACRAIAARSTPRA